MFENLKKLYLHYGGVGAAMKSGYFWVSLAFTALSYNSISNFDWSDKALSVMPSLTGFTVAAFAIIFAILDPESLRKLMVPDDSGGSPIAAISASIGHAVFVQVSAMMLAMSSKLVDLRDLVEASAGWTCFLEHPSSLMPLFFDRVAFFISAIGLFLTYYGVMLVLAAILSIVRMQLIVANSKKPKQPER